MAIKNPRTIVYEEQVETHTKSSAVISKSQSHELFTVRINHEKSY